MTNRLIGGTLEPDHAIELVMQELYYTATKMHSSHYMTMQQGIRLVGSQERAFRGLALYATETWRLRHYTDAQDAQDAGYRKVTLKPSYEVTSLGILLGEYAYLVCDYIQM